MKIISIAEPQIIMSNPNSKHSYFGWPTATRLQNGKIAVATACPAVKISIRTEVYAPI